MPRIKLPKVGDNRPELSPREPPPPPRPSIEQLRAKNPEDLLPSERKRIAEDDRRLAAIEAKRVPAAQAAKHVIERRLLRQDFAQWARYKGFEPAAHHLLIIRSIEEFLASSDDILLLFAPPGSAKSTYISVLLPSWYLANHPTHQILFATHSIEFAQRWGRKIRGDILADGQTLGVHLSEQNAATDRWALQEGGEYYAVGAGVGIAGFRADLGIGDDFFGSREDAWSASVRQKRWEWYIDDFSARLKPHAKRILMNTRWHEEDVAGRILGQIERGVVKGRVISIPAKALPGDLLGRHLGEYLWDDPSGYDYGSFLRARERESTPMMWSALYQQSPAPEEGDYFKADWLKSYDRTPARETLKVYGASDYAVTADGGDFTVHLVIGMDPDGRMYVLDLWRDQASSDVWVEAFCDLVKRWKPIGWAEESGQIRSGVGPYLERRQRERKAYVFRQSFPSKHDKAIRAQSIRGRMALEGLYLPSATSWLPDFRAELMHFPAGKHDDMVDALSLLGQLLDEMLVGVKPKPKPKVVELVGYKVLRDDAKPDDWRCF
jgi:predicted phage terminase large subunit-like protein